MTITCISVANYFIAKTDEYNKTVDFMNQISMSCKRLQKLLYFSDIFFMKTHNGKPMLKEEFYAWPSGPVIPSIYDKFMNYHDGRMMQVEITDNSFSNDIRNTLDIIFENTINIDTNTLVEMSQAFGGPWNQVYDPDDPGHFQIVMKESMHKFYIKKSVLGVNSNHILFFRRHIK